MLNYFAYGSNISIHRMLNERKINFINRKFATLKNHKLVFNKVSKNNPNLGFANVTKCEGFNVEGALYELKESDFKVIDRFEGFPKHYYKKIVEVICDEQNLSSIIYIANPIMIRENIKPNKNYLNYILEGKDIFSEKYYEKLQLIDTLD